MKTWHARAAFLLAAFAALVAGQAASQPFGSARTEFRVNTTTIAGYQGQPNVGMDTAGAFLITWHEPSRVIFAQRFDRSGTRVGPEFRVNTSSAYPYSPAAGGAGPGAFTVVWRNSTLGVRPWVDAQRFSGAPVGPEFRVSTTTGVYNLVPEVAADPAGDFVVLWTRSGDVIANNDVIARLYSSSGAPVTGEFTVNAPTLMGTGTPSVSKSANGSFVVAWGHTQTGPGLGYAWAQRFSSAGAALGPVLKVNSPTAASSQHVGVATDAEGDFVVVWAGGNVFAQRYTSAGDALGEDFQVNTVTTGYSPISAKVVADSSGNFVVVWGLGAGEYSLYARRFQSSGAPIGDPFRVTPSTAGDPRLGDVAGDPAGNFVVTWMSRIGGDYDIWARQFCSTLAGNANGDATVDVGDVFYLINRLFAGGPAPVKGSDVNGDGVVSVVDVFYLINYLFAAGPAPVCA